MRVLHVPAAVVKQLILVAAASLFAGSTAFAEVHVTLHDGLVTVVARDATVRQILTEWARVGKMTIVNIERIPGGPISIELTDVPEEQALDVLLVSVSGYMAAARGVAAANLSRLDRVVVMATSVAPGAPGTAVLRAPVFRQPSRFAPPPASGDLGDEERSAPRGAPLRNSRVPIFNTFPLPPVVNPRNGQAMSPQVSGPQGQQPPMQPAQPSTDPRMPTGPFGGVAIPGMIAPSPPQAGQIAAPPVRRRSSPEEQ
jgi:hypothetical protein